jgi:Domain of Unknown Function (DUF1080)
LLGTSFCATMRLKPLSSCTQVERGIEMNYASRFAHKATNWMRSLWCCSTAVLLVVVLSTVVWAGDNEPPPGFTALFNGHDLAGWKVPEGDGGHWKVVDGAIDYDAQSEARGDKSLWLEREFGDFELHVDWRIKEAPYTNRNVPYILPDGTHARDIHGKELKLALPDADSGIFLRGSGDYQVNIWCWPIGSGEMYGIRTNPNTAPELRAAVTPRMQADNPIGQWNRFEITVRGNTVRTVLNGKVVILGAQIPDLPSHGRLALQHHGGKRDGQWAGPPSLVQFKNIFIKELVAKRGPRPGRPAAQ